MCERERERERECVCVCARKRENERERGLRVTHLGESDRAKVPGGGGVSQARGLRVRIEEPV